MPAKLTGADLHLHTNCSDGTYTPELLAERAVALQLRAIAVTDHDTLAGIVPVREAAAGRVEVVSGVEFSVECEGVEIHLVGLFIDENHAALREALQEYRRRREARVYEIVDCLAECGIALKPDRVFECAGAGVAGRVHVARAMVEDRLVPDLNTAFNKYLGQGRRAAVPKVRHTPERTLELIREAGGVSVWAHPGLTRHDDFLPRLVEAGLMGIEAYSSSHSPSDERHYTRLAKRHRLLVSGGSDCHGMNKERLLMGAVRLSDKRLEAIRGAAGK